MQDNVFDKMLQIDRIDDGLATEGGTSSLNNKSPDTIVSGLCTPSRRKAEPIFRGFEENSRLKYVWRTFFA